MEGAQRVEVWTDAGMTMETDSGVEFYAHLWGLPPDTTMFKPRLIQGRWLNADDEFAIVLNSRAAMQRNIQVGDTLTWRFDSKKRKWLVVGIIVDSRDGQVNSFVPLNTLTTLFGYSGRGTLITAEATQHDAVYQAGLAERLRQALETTNIKVFAVDPAAKTGAQIQSQFDIVVYLLLTMTLLAAIVGSIGLMGTLSINVVERTREIGVMRAIGARSLGIIGLYLTEGITVGVLSWLLAVPLSYPASQVLGEQVGILLLQAPLDFVYSQQGAVDWLLIIVGLAMLASALPAWRAAQRSVREALVYE